ncbi:MAG: hypothetical protein HDT14_07840 [Oscillibacter sp.]|nr:hypothetical protein [Oscillibacter sp.]
MPENMAENGGNGRGMPLPGGLCFWDSGMEDRRACLRFCREKNVALQSVSDGNMQFWEKIYQNVRKKSVEKSGQDFRPQRRLWKMSKQKRMLLYQINKNLGLKRACA